MCEKVKRAILSDSDRIQVGTNVLLKFTFQDELEESYQKKLYEQATKDALTGVHNKKYFVDHLKTEFAYAYRHHEPLSLILLDIDYFKKVNDTYGHVAGDIILKEMATVVNETCVKKIFARYGGEELAVVLKNTDLAHAVLIAERYGEWSSPTSITSTTKRFQCFFLGVDPYWTKPSETYFPSTRGNHCLYEAKNAGRNRVMLVRRTLKNPS